MGQSLDYKVNNGEALINIILEKYDFFPGEIIKGNLILKSFNFLKKGIVEYKLFNHEYYSYNEETNLNSNLERKNINIIFTKSLVYNNYIDYSLSKGIKIPFSILLKNDIFPNFEYCLSKVKGYIRNFLEINIPELNLTKQQLIIIKKPFMITESLLSFNKVENLNIFGIFKKGNISFNASYKKNCYRFLDKVPIKVIIQINGNNNVNIIKIKNLLLRKIIFKNNNNINNIEIKYLLFNNQIDININLDKNNNHLELDNYVCIEEPESLFNKYKLKIHNFYFLNIKDKSYLMKLIPDVDSNLIKCEYKIIIIITYSSSFKKGDVCLEMPIYVYHEENKINFEINKESNLNNKKTDILINNDKEKEEIKYEIQNEKKKKNVNIKEPHIFTNYGDDYWNTPTNGV